MRLILSLRELIAGTNKKEDVPVDFLRKRGI